MKKKMTTRMSCDYEVTKIKVKKILVEIDNN